jgi:hypothetical protein
MFSVLKQNLISPPQPGMLQDSSHNQFPRPRLAQQQPLFLLSATTSLNKDTRIVNITSEGWMLTPSGGIVFGLLVYATSKVLTLEDGCGISLWGATVQKEGP